MENNKVLKEKELKETIKELLIEELTDRFGHGDYEIYNVKIKLEARKLGVLDDDAPDYEGEFELEIK